MIKMLKNCDFKTLAHEFMVESVYVHWMISKTFLLSKFVFFHLILFCLYIDMAVCVLRFFYDSLSNLSAKDVYSTAAVLICKIRASSKWFICFFYYNILLVHWSSGSRKKMGLEFYTYLDFCRYILSYVCLVLNLELFSESTFYVFILTKVNSRSLIIFR